MSRASGDRLHFPSCHQEFSSHGTRSVRVGRLFLLEARREQYASSSSGRNESHDPNVRASGDRLQSEDDDTTKLLPPGIKLLSSLVRRIEENLKNNFGNLNLTNFPVNTSVWCIFARDCMWTSFKMSRSVETCSIDCQNNAFLNKQGITNIVIGSLFENEQDGELVIVRDEETLSGECLT